jgi:hypothetical protein
MSEARVKPLIVIHDAETSKFYIEGLERDLQE